MNRCRRIYERAVRACQSAQKRQWFFHPCSTECLTLEPFPEHEADRVGVVTRLAYSQLCTYCHVGAILGEFAECCSAVESDEREAR